ncbi:MAG: FAD-binding oxidoreductase [Candidatus Melainabacteria bacterium]|nr:FAD-binding oxidoreductase [Candidatus Melainabacteria bacterium]
MILKISASPRYWVAILAANITMSRKRQSAAEIQSKAELASVLQNRGDGVYLLPGAARELPQQFEAGERDINFVTLAKHKDVIEYCQSDQVISLCLGLTIGEVMEITGQNKQFLPLCADYQSTLFDVLNNGDGGLWEHSFGGPRDLVMGIQAILTDGRTIKTGGKVVKNVTGYDTTKIFVGGRMYFGVPVSAHFRLYARPEWTHTLEFAAQSVLELLDQASVFMQSDIPITTLAICGSKDEGAKMYVQLTGHRVVVDELVKPFKAQTAKSISVSDSAYEFDPREEKLLPNCQTGKDAIEISASLMQMRLVLAQLNDILSGSTELKLRPGTGRLAICCNSPDEKNRCLDHLRLTLESAGISLAAAYSDEVLERKIERIGLTPDGSSNQAIVRSLKLRFDQKRILNPLVSW